MTGVGCHESVDERATGVSRERGTPASRTTDSLAGPAVDVCCKSCPGNEFPDTVRVRAMARAVP